METVRFVLSRTLDIASPIAIGLGSYLVFMTTIRQALVIGAIPQFFWQPMPKPGERRMHPLAMWIYIAGRLIGLHFLFAFIAILIGCSGALLPIVLAKIWWPELLQRADFLWGGLTATIIATLRIMTQVHLMEIPDVFEELPRVSKYLKIDFGREFNNEDLNRLTRAYFQLMTVQYFFIIIVCYVASCLFINNLHLSSKEELLQIPQSPQEFVGAWRILSDVTSTPGAMVPAVLNVFYGVNLIVFSMYFLGISSGLIDGRLSAFIKRRDEQPNQVSPWATYDPYRNAKYTIKEPTDGQP